MALNPPTNLTTIPAMLAARAASGGAATILRKKDRGIWKAIDWTELETRVRRVGMGLRADSFRSGDIACTLAETRPEWVYADLGILGAGGVSGGIHPAEEAEQLCETLREHGCSVLFAENEEQLDKVLAVRERCPTLRRIIVFDMKGLRDFSDPMCESFETLLSRGADYDGSHIGDWASSIAAIATDQPAILLTPQGSKGGTLTHGDALHLVANARAMLPAWSRDERLALLPMCSAMERVLGLYLALDTNMISNYLENPDTVVENLQEVQPTVLATDPDIWERLYTRIKQSVADATYLQRLLYRLAISAGQRGGVQAALARWCVLRCVRRDIGIARLRLVYMGASPLAAEVERWAAALGITIHRIDGQATRGVASDPRYRALTQEAFST